MLLLQINALDDSVASISGLCSLTGSEYSRLAPTEQASAVARLSVFARVEPSHKSNLVARLKEQVCAWRPQQQHDSRQRSGLGGRW